MTRSGRKGFAASLLATLVCAGLLVNPAPLQAQTGTVGAAPAPAAQPPSPSEEAQEPDVLVSPDSPRAAVAAFLELTGKARFADAADHLLLDASDRTRAAQLSERLRAVLDRRLPLRVEALSPSSDGNRDDGLPAGTESLGNIPNAEAGLDPVYLVRVRDARGARWVFSRRTVAHVDAWYDALEDRWIRDYLPEALLRHGPWCLLWWQWLALPVLGLLGWVAGRVLGSLTRRLLHRLVLRTPSDWDNRILARTAPALALLWAALVMRVLLPFLALPPAAQSVVQSVLMASVALAIFWAIWRSTNVAVAILMQAPAAVADASVRSLIAIGGNLVKVFVVVGAALATLSAFGYPVTTVLAGLGIGGVALAFGAQKTIADLFGSIALAADRPLHIGDFVKIDDFTGNVERIGLRSTQIRTLDRTLVSLPNGQLADKRIETFGVRDRIRLATTIGIEYGATREQIEQVVAGFESVMRGHPRTWPDVVVARFAGFGVSSLDIEIMCWFLTADYNEFRDCRQEVLLGFMKVVEEAGTRFAFPTQTLHLASVPRALGAGTARG
jgi:MscS family membrane protein